MHRISRVEEMAPIGIFYATQPASAPLHAFAPQMIFVSAGFDAHRDDDMSHLLWSERDYAWLTRQIVDVAKLHAQGRIVSMLEGATRCPRWRGRLRPTCAS